MNFGKEEHLLGRILKRKVSIDEIITERDLVPLEDNGEFSNKISE